MHFGKFRKALKVLVVLFVLNVGMADRPAYAIYNANCVNCPALFATQTLALNAWLEKVILGSHAVNPVYPNMIPGLTAAEQFVPIPLKTPVLGLVDYFEQVFWPRQLTMEQRKAQSNDKTNAANVAFNNSMADSVATTQHAFDLKKTKAVHTVETYGREAYACEHATRNVTAVSRRIITNVEVRNETITYLTSLGGSSSFPMYSKGLVNFYRQKVLGRNTAGYCDATGNDGADSAWCTSPQPMLVNADQRPETLLEPYTYQEVNPALPNYSGHMKAYIANLFPQTFTPMRSDQLTGMPGTAAEIMAEKSSYMAQIATLHLPFAEAFKQRKPIASTQEEIKNSYKASLALVGITDPSVLGLFVNQTDGTLSERAMEEIQYRISNVDPQTTIKSTGASALNAGNVALFQALKMMDMVVLLYDIRQEMRQNNQLLGTIGSILSNTKYEQIEAKIRARAAGK